MTTDGTVDCYYCGRSNPEWAQVCRSCGVPLRHGQARVVPTGRFPTDPGSLVSIAAVIGVIFAAVLVGIFVSSLNPTDPSVGSGLPTPTATPSPSVQASVAPTDTPAPTPEPTPRLPGRIAFGTELDENRLVVERVRTFTPSLPFAYSVTMPDGFGTDAIENEIAKLGAGGGENIVLPRQSVGVEAGATSFGYVVGTAGDFLGQWGPGQFEWRVYADGSIVARGRFRYSEG
jgi:hypothetical protein